MLRKISDLWATQLEEGALSITISELKNGTKDIENILFIVHLFCAL